MKFFFTVTLSISLFHMKLAYSSTNKINQSHYRMPSTSTGSDQYSGFDQHGNFFRGNKKTGFYYNYGTGETCFGKNQQRKCYMAKN